jgi:hypothetical protein
LFETRRYLPKENSLHRLLKQCTKRSSVILEDKFHVLQWQQNVFAVANKAVKRRLLQVLLCRKLLQNNLKRLRVASL